MSKGASKFSHAAKKLLWLWIGLLILAAATKFGPLALLTLALTGAMPFILIILWLGLSDTGRKIRGWFKVWHLRVLSGALIFCYVTYGHKWAGDTINELFNVDAKYFGVTSTVLTVLFTPFGIIYRPDVTGMAFDAFLVLTATAGPFLVWYLLAATSIKDRGKKIAYVFLIVIAGTAGLALAFDISNMFKPMIKTFAVWADFNENSPCTDPWTTDAKGVVFLDNGKVLAYFPRASDYQFKVVSCDYAKKF